MKHWLILSILSILMLCPLSAPAAFSCGVTDTNIHVPASYDTNTAPASGAFTYTDAPYNCNWVRLVAANLAHDYSKNSPLNVNDTIIALHNQADSGHWVFYNFPAGTLLCATTLSSNAEVRWDRSDPDKFWFHDQPSTQKIYKGSLSANCPGGTWTKPAAYDTLSAMSDVTFCAGESQVSLDGNYLPVCNAALTDIRRYTLASKTLGPSVSGGSCLNVSGVTVNAAYLSALNSNILVHYNPTSNTSCSASSTAGGAIDLFNSGTGAFIKQISNFASHDIPVTDGTSEWEVMVDATDPSNICPSEGGVISIAYSTLQRTCLAPFMIGGSIHASYTGLGNGNYVLIASAGQLKNTTTCSSGCTVAPGSATVTLAASMSNNYSYPLWINRGQADAEIVTSANWTANGTTPTITFANSHSGAWTAELFAWGTYPVPTNYAPDWGKGKQGHFINEAVLVDFTRSSFTLNNYANVFVQRPGLHHALSLSVTGATCATSDSGCYWHIPKCAQGMSGRYLICTSTGARDPVATETEVYYVQVRP